MVSTDFSECRTYLYRTKREVLFVCVCVGVSVSVCGILCVVVCDILRGNIKKTTSLNV